MQRGRMAVLGRRGLFEDSLVAALAANRHLRVRRFCLDGPGTTGGDISAFEPEMIVVVSGIDQPVPEELRTHMEKGVAIVTVDPTQPVMGFSCQMRTAPATLESILRAMRATRVILGGKPRPAAEQPA